jgi:hypothetical protein
MKMRAFVTILPLFFITTSLAEIIENFKLEFVEFIQKEECTKDPITCWLENLVFKIPDTCFMVEKTECCITNFICSGIDIGGIGSEYSAPTSLFFELEDLGTKCSGEWKYGRLGGSLSATISKTDVSTTAVVGKDAIYPNSLVFSSCAIPSISIDLKFSGGLVGFVLQLISGIVENGLEKAIYTIFCEKAEPVISEKVTAALVTTINPALHTVISYGPSTPPAFPDNTYIDWSTSIPGLLEKVEDKFANDYLNKIVDTLTGGTGIIKIDLHNATMEWPVVDPTAGELATIKLTLHNFEVSGLDTFYDISLLTPSDPASPSYSPYSVWSAFSVHSLGMSLGATIDVILDQGALQGGELKETFTLKLEVSDTTLGADLLIPVSMDRFGDLYLNQMFDISCLLSTADALSISSLVFNTHISSVKVAQSGPDGTLEQDLDALINNLLELGVEGFPDLLSGVISGIAQGPLRSALNTELSELLSSSSSKCVPHVATDDTVAPDYVIWSESGGLESLNYALNTMLGVSGINDLITSATGGSGSVTIPISFAELAITLFGLNTFYKFSLITPSLDVNKPYNLDSELALGYCEGHSRNQICTPVGVSLVKSNPSLSGSDLMASTLSGNFYNFDLTASLFAKLNKNDLVDLQVSDLFVYSGNHSGCFLSAFDSLSLESFGMAISEAKLSKGALVNKDITEGVEKLLSVITSEEAVGAINEVFTLLLSDAGVACETGAWPIHEGDDDDDHSPADDCEGPIQCGLNKIVIGPFPDLCVDVKEGMVGICVKQFSCYDIDVVNINSENVSPQTLMLGVGEFAFTCGADISVVATPSGFPKPLTYDGSVRLSMSNFTGTVDLAFGSSPSTSSYPPLPNSLRFTNCHTSHTQFKVKFEGGVIGSVLDKVVSAPLEEALESAVYWALCDVLNPLLGHVISKVLKDKVDPAIESLIDKSVAPPAVLMSGYLHWNDTIVGKLHQVIDFMRANEAKVLRCMIGDKSPLDGYNINSLINMITDNTGVVEIDLNIPISIGEVTLVLNVLTITGLNTIGDLILLNPTPESGVTLSSTIDLSLLDLQLSVILKDTDGDYEQEAVLDLKLTNSTLAFDIVAAMRLSVLNNLYSDQILHLPCLMSALDEFFLNSLVLEMTVDNLSITQISGGDATALEEDTAEFINNLFDLLLDGYPLMVTDMIAGVFQGPVKDRLNKKLGEVVSSYKSSHVCVNHGNYTDVNWIEWVDSNLIEKANILLNDILGANGVNEFIDCVTDGTGLVSFFFPPTSPIFADWKLTLGGLDTFSDFALVYPLTGEPYDLGNTLLLGDSSSSPNFNNFTVGLEGYESSGQFSRVLLEFQNLKLYLDLLLGLDLHSLKNLRYEELHSDGCFLSTIDKLSFQALSVTARSVNFFFLNGTSDLDISSLVAKVFSLLSDPNVLMSIDAHIQDRLDRANTLCVNGYLPTNTDDDLTQSSSAYLLSWKLKLVVFILFALLSGYSLSKLLHSFGIVHENSDKEHLLSSHQEKNITATNLFYDSPSVQSVILFSNAWWTLHIKKIFDIKDEDGGRNHPPRHSQTTSTDEQNEIEDSSMADQFVYDALIASDALSPLIRLSIPLVIVGLSVAFIFSLLNPAAYVMMEIKAGDIILGNTAIFDFGYGGTVSDLWVADAYFLSIIITLFTGVWPFVKLALLLLAWVLPTSIFLLEHRDFVLRWVDILGKWSLVDTYVMVLMMVAFHVKLSVVPGVTIALTVAPHWQFYTFLGATMGSLIIGHIALGCHRAVSETPIIIDHLKEQTYEAMMNHSFTMEVFIPPQKKNLKKADEEENRERKEEDEIGAEEGIWKFHKLSFTTSGKIFVFFVLSFGLFIVVNGTLLNSVTFELKGLTGYLMKDPISSYSLIDVGLNIPSSSGDPSSFGVRFIQFSYFLFSITLPMGFITMLIILWVMPFKLSTQKSVILSVEMLNAWSALDVMVLSIIASVLEIKQYAKFLIGDSCDAIDEVLAEEMDSELDGDDTCFDVAARMKTVSKRFVFFLHLLIISSSSLFSHRTLLWSV